MSRSSAPGALPARERRAAALRLGGYSFVILFLELALIRYVPGHVRVFGFYLNFVLIATFLGMGVGLLRAEDARRLRWVAVPALLLLFGAVRYFANVVVEVPVDRDEALWGVFFEVPPSVRRVGVLPVAVLLFALCALVFVPLGALLGGEFRKFRPLHAYCIDIGGSLLGILAFGAASLLRSSPPTWFVVAFAVWAALAWERSRFPLVLAATAAAALAMGRMGRSPGTAAEYWSPYYRISVFRPRPNLLSLDVNGSFHQYVVNLDTAEVRRNPVSAALWRDYVRPLSFVRGVDTALVLGSGTGNDVALLLQAGVRWVDAVEIDPTILAIGKAAHFQHPYADPRVHAHVQDARAFLRRTDRRYDLIVLGTLDSQTLLSGMSSVRLDNYVYTREAFQAARDRLKPQGYLVTYHMSPAPYIAAKIHRTLVEAFGAEPLVLYEPRHRLFNYTFVAGPNLPLDAGVGRGPFASVAAEVVTPRDDWPYLYLARPTVPAHYLWALAGVLCVAGLMVGWAAGRQLATGFDGALFFMGAGFLLVETKSVTEMALLFGSTWVVNLLVFASILLVILIANLLVLWRPPARVAPLFLGLFGTLALAFAVPARELLWLSLPGQWLVGGLLVALPIFFAALIFATLFRTREATPRALGYNLLGAIVGGTLEYSSMAIGIKGLYVIAALAYGAAFLYARTDHGLRSGLLPGRSVAR